MRRSHYDVLGVSQDASSAQLKTAFHAAALRLHPDKQKQPPQQQATDGQYGYIEVQRAYQVLSNAHLRQVHDRELQLACMRDCMTFQDELHVNEMTPGMQQGVAGFLYSCRCGGFFWLPRSDIAASVQHAVLPCPNCSSHVLVDVTGVHEDPPQPDDELAQFAAQTHFADNADDYQTKIA